MKLQPAKSEKTYQISLLVMKSKFLSVLSKVTNLVFKTSKVSLSLVVVAVLVKHSQFVKFPAVLAWKEHSQSILQLSHQSKLCVVVK